jgi:heptosyltransferase-1
VPFSAPPKRILLVRLSHLGDVIHALPVYHALRDAFPRARIAWAVQPEFSELVWGLPGIDRVLKFNRHAGLTGWWQLVRELREYGADWTIDAQGNMKSAAVTLLSAARRRSGMHAQDWSEALGAWVLNDPAERYSRDTGRHAIDRSLHLAAHVAGTTQQVESAKASRWLPLSEKETTRGRERYAELFDTKRHSPIILQVAMPSDVRSWPLHRQLEFLRLTSAAGTQVLALSGPVEEEIGIRVQRDLANSALVKHWVGQRGLRELAGFFHACAEKGAPFVGCDSGPLHLAAACGMQVTCLSGPQDALRTGPWPAPGENSMQQIVRAPIQLACAPCMSRTCERAEGTLCMEHINPELVLATLAERFDA